jgi:hypothetical protein
MLFCPTCDRAMVRSMATGAVTFKCTSCLREEKGAPADARVSGAVHGASELMVNASRMAQRIEALADSLAKDAGSLRDGALPMLDRASVALEELNRVLIAARTGDGTIGRLMKDPALYEGLTDAANRLNEALAKINLLVEKIRAEGVDVELFK